MNNRKIIDQVFAEKEEQTDFSQSPIDFKLVKEKEAQADFSQLESAESKSAFGNYLKLTIK